MTPKRLDALLAVFAASPCIRTSWDVLSERTKFALFAALLKLALRR